RLGGRWAIEALTDRMEREARAYIQRIDELGGMIKAIELGYPQKEIAEAAYVYQQELERGEKTVVGVNRYQVPEERPPELLRVPLEVEARQAERVRRWKRERNGTAAREATRRVREAAESGDNLMPPIIAAVKAGVTVGEISDVYRQGFGGDRDPGGGGAGGRCASWVRSRGSTGPIAAPRSSPRACVTPAWRASTPGRPRRPRWSAG